MLAAIRTMCFVISISAVFAQTFVRVTNPENEAATTPGATGYLGCAWVDYDNDGDDDLWVNRNHLYRNDGGGVFVDAQVGVPAQTGLGSGCSWADYDNDGDLDLYIADSPRSSLYRNDNGAFMLVDQGDISPVTNDIRSWSAAWGDYDNDGNVDLILTHPGGFLGNPALTNLMFRNDGPPNHTFTQILEGDVVTGLGPYTVGSFADFDLDGDLDYNIGTGPVSAPGVDHFYLNTLRESGVAELVNFNGIPLTDQTRDGQNINWIDYDNDGDLDCYITNYTAGFNGGRVNDLYRNDDGEYVRITDGAIVTDRQTSLGNCWGDLDNDGWLDCIVANETGTNKYYHNLGDGTFQSVVTAFTGPGAFRCPALSDYDNDGDLDLFITSAGASQAMYRNTTDNGNHWLKLKLIGTESNRAALGAVVRIKCQLGDEAVWQIRDVNSQNSFCGHNSYTVHFGCRDATLVDSLEIRWPSGLIEYYTGLNVAAVYEFVEGSTLDGIDPPVLPHNFTLAAYPNPFNNVTTIRYTGPQETPARLEIFDIQGRTIKRFENLKPSAGLITFAAEKIATGTYFARLLDQSNRQLAEPLKLVYIR